jgi:hypothetical protein
MTKSKNIRNLEKAIAAQEWHVARMMEKYPNSPATLAGKRVLFVFNAELEFLKAGKEFNAADMNAASAAARLAVR